ncbi:uncharacterized protein [Paramisgurnus dabryanus]|uniref:uncharacterized protein isoform X4 n=1 Tax=Paramisgurnus dabryanus TaxID=90735 RepID=UPI0031F44AC1
MKTTILLFIISLFINGVVTHESVSVMEGDSVTLYTNTVIHKGYLIEWRFGDDHYLIARVNGGTNRVKIYADVLNGRFRDRLQVNDQTGDLTFTNITTQHTGLYQLEIINMGNTTKTFNINVFGDKVKTVMMGDSFILHNNVIKKSGDEKIVWRIQHNSSTVAEIIRNGKETNDKVHDERFRGRLKVDDQTGDLIITNITTEDFGSYEVDITVGRHTYTIHRSFTVKGSGTSQWQTSSLSCIQVKSTYQRHRASVCIGTRFWFKIKSNCNNSNHCCCCCSSSFCCSCCHFIQTSFSWLSRLRVDLCLFVYPVHLHLHHKEFTHEH